MNWTLLDNNAFWLEILDIIDAFSDGLNNPHPKHTEFDTLYDCLKQFKSEQNEKLLEILYSVYVEGLFQGWHNSSLMILDTIPGWMQFAKLMKNSKQLQSSC